MVDSGGHRLSLVESMIFQLVLGRRHVADLFEQQISWRRGRDSNPRSPCGDAGFQVSDLSYARDQAQTNTAFVATDQLRPTQRNAGSRAEWQRSGDGGWSRVAPPIRVRVPRRRFKSGARYFDWKKTGSRSSCGRPSTSVTSTNSSANLGQPVAAGVAGCIRSCPEMKSPDSAGAPCCVQHKR